MTDGPQQPNQPGGEQPPSGYGYPQQQPGYGYPQQSSSGYGYPQQQSGYGYPQQPPQDDEEQPAGPAWTPPSGHIGGSEPDWTALADRAEVGSRRRRLLLIGGGILAVVVVAGIVSTAVVVSGHHGRTVAAPTGSPGTGADQPTPTFSDVTPPPAPDPLAVLSSSQKDTAPLAVQELFPRDRLDFPGRSYVKTATDSTTSCAAVTGDGLGGVLAEYGCRKVLRATYERDGTAVTVGVALFDTKADADGAKDHAVPYLAPLGSFCHGTSCQATANSVGRYAYFTIAGRSDDVAVTQTDPQTEQCAKDVADFVFASIVQRGRQEAAASPGTS